LDNEKDHVTISPGVILLQRNVKCVAREIWTTLRELTSLPARAFADSFVRGNSVINIY